MALEGWVRVLEGTSLPVWSCWGVAYGGQSPGGQVLEECGFTKGVT